MKFDVAERALVVLHDESPSVRAAVSRSMDPYLPACGGVSGEPTIELTADPSIAPTFADVQHPARDGTTTATDATTLYLVHGERSCSIPDVASGTPFEIRYEPGYPVARLVRPVLRPALQIGLLDRHAITIHSSCVEIDGGALVVAGWSETGKTETALAFAEAGGRFIADKWTIVDDDRIAWPFPISVGVRRWVLPHLPRLRSALPLRTRAQMGVAAGVGAFSRAAALGGRDGGLRRSLERAAALADRAALRLSELHVIYNHLGATHEVPRARLRTLAFLTTVRSARIVAEPADPRRIARRLVRTATYERRPFFGIDERRRFGLPNIDARAASSVEAREEERLTELLADLQLIEVQAPFPTDPRPVRDAIARCL